MSPLAAAVYAILRARVPAKQPELAYSDLVARLPVPYDKLDPDSDLLAQALGELVTGCRAKGLPAISAMVIRFRERIPGPGYYPMAHPAEATDPAKAMIAWGIELEKVRVTTYPATL